MDWNKRKYFIYKRNIFNLGFRNFCKWNNLFVIRKEKLRVNIYNMCIYIYIYIYILRGFLNGLK